MALGWQQTSAAQMNELCKTTVFNQVGDKMYVGPLLLSNFPGDCGALIMQRANSATHENLKFVKEFASRNGFSKIFATVVTGDDAVLSKLKKAYRRAGWIRVYEGKSNRNDYKTDIVYCLVIRNCKYKGY